ncbi:hypothetical protein Slin15195_G061580 [Septoria linicola]|uniref:Uncharacterized protein n=1 Tax=Septoria linicola TaxID=215465 RepID=A0A9Q9AQV7_9PEZI|nr:hypothetical protein Slin15195_G061580 [Septoria linicola]
MPRYLDRLVLVAVTIVSTCFAKAAGSAIEQRDCLSTSEAHTIATKYIQIFNTDATGQIPTGTALPLAILSSDYTQIDEDAVVCGDPARPECYFRLVNSVELASEAARNASLGVKEGDGRGFTPLYTEYTSAVLHSFASCDEIAIRLGASAKAAEGNRAVTAPEGTMLKWKGTVLLKVDSETRLIVSGESSEDRLHIFSQLGLKSIDDILNA